MVQKIHVFFSELLFFEFKNSEKWFFVILKIITKAENSENSGLLLNFFMEMHFKIQTIQFFSFFRLNIYIL